MPLAGGEPKRITKLVPSYFHGWSPDGKWLVYTGGRDGEFDVFRIASDGSGDETNLTRSKGLDDGPEYSPDGKWVYFNSVRSGTMQVWRMRPDGSEPQQMTNDELNNWFPHLTPDGKQLVFASNRGGKVGRNDPCPCGSGKKYKNCHMGRNLPPGLRAG